MLIRTLFTSMALVCTSQAHAGIIEKWVGYLWTSEPEKAPTVKLLITHDQPGVVLEVKGKYHLYDPNDNQHFGTRFIGKRKYIQAEADGLQWGEEFPGIHQIKIVPDDYNTVTVIDGVEYDGDMYVYDVGGTLSIVNEVDLEKYLNTTLSPQFGENVPEEALAAVAITDRTNAYYLTKNAKSSYWDLDAKATQYDGVNSTKSPVQQAVKSTRYMVMLKDGEPFPAAWGSATGGSNPKDQKVFSRISLYEAEQMAKSGMHAAQILQKAFPGTTLELMYTSK